MLVGAFLSNDLVNFKEFFVDSIDIFGSVSTIKAFKCLDRKHMLLIKYGNSMVLGSSGFTMNHDSYHEYYVPTYIIFAAMYIYTLNTNTNMTNIAIHIRRRYNI